MATFHTLVLNGKRIRAAEGQTVLDAALAGRVVIPHDCSTGQCNTCRVRLYAGEVDDQGTRRGDTVLACRTTLTGEAVIEFDDVPPVVKRPGIVTEVTELTADIVQVVVTLRQRLDYLPGQYVKLTFKGLPERDYSPTLRGDGSAELDELVFHIRREPRGAVSQQIGRSIRVGTSALARGPFGNAYHRRGAGRLLLLSTGTGWAPIWAIARAARFREPGREMIVIAGARNPANLYMRESVDWLIGTGVQRAFLTSTEGGSSLGMLTGRPTRFLPRLRSGDTVYAAGAPGMVAAVELLAAAGEATCYADPFLPAADAHGRRSTFAEIFRLRPRRLGAESLG